MKDIVEGFALLALVVFQLLLPFVLFGAAVKVLFF